MKDKRLCAGYELSDCCYEEFNKKRKIKTCNKCNNECQNLCIECTEEDCINREMN